MAFDNLKAPSFFTSRINCILLSFLVIGPLAYLPRLNELKITSCLSFLVILMIVVVIILYSTGSDGILEPCPSTNDDQCDGTKELMGHGVETLKAFPILIFSYACQQNAFNIFNEIENPTQERIDSVSYTSTISTLVLFIIVSCCGYKTFGTNVEADILAMYPENGLTSVCRIGLAFICICHFPLQFNPGRKSAIALVSAAKRFNFKRDCCCFTSSTDDASDNDTSTNESTRLNLKNARSKSIDNEEEEHSNELDISVSNTSISAQEADLALYNEEVQSHLNGTTARYYIVTTVMLLVNLTIGLAVTDLGNAWGVAGATGSTMLVLILPGAFYYYSTIKHTSTLLKTKDLDYYSKKISDPVKNPITNVFSKEETGAASQNHEVDQHRIHNASSSPYKGIPIQPLLKKYLALVLLLIGCFMMPFGLVLTFM